MTRSRATRRITTTLADGAAKAAKNKADGTLTAILVAALTEIIEKNPARPADLRGLSEEKIKERRDIENLTWLLHNVHWPTLEEYIEQGPKFRSAAVVDFCESFEWVLNTTYFHLYDKSLNRKIAPLRRAWTKAMSHAENYETVRDGQRYVFTTPVNSPMSRGEAADWKIISKGIAELRPTSAIQASTLRP